MLMQPAHVHPSEPIVATHMDISSVDLRPLTNELGGRRVLRPTVLLPPCFMTLHDGFLPALALLLHTDCSDLAHLVRETCLCPLVSVVSHSLLLCLLKSGNSPHKGHRMLAWLCLLGQREQSPGGFPHRTAHRLTQRVFLAAQIQVILGVCCAVSCHRGIE
jgi:hypothetical protein